MAPAPHIARAFWVVEPGRGDIREEALPVCGEADVRVRTRWTGVSRGTEALVFSGRVPLSEHDRMRAPFQSGVFPAPVKYGYANVGVVEEGPSALLGRHVFTLFPHQTSFVVPANAVHPLPDSVPAARGVLAANMETALTILWDAAPSIGDRITVVGAGVVGALVAWLARGIASPVQLVDIDPGRASLAQALGVDFAQPDTATPDADVVIHTSGSPAGLPHALHLAGLEARIVDASWYGSQVVAVPLGEAFHARRLQIISSQVGRIPAAHAARWDTRRRMALALSKLTDPVLDFLISGESGFDDLPATMARLATHPAGTLCHRIRY